MIRTCLLLALLGIPAFPKILFKADFETGDLSQWSQTGTRGQNATARNIQIVTDVVQEGKYAAKFTIHEDGVFNAQQLRAQIGGPRITVEEGSDTYMSFSLYMADAPKDRDNFFYWEGNPPPKYDNVMTWWVEPRDGGGTLIKYGTGNLGRNGTEWSADFSTGKWHRLTMHIHWSEDATKGNTRLWFDGALVLDKKLKTKGPESVYFCQPGIHRSPHKPSTDSIYFDNFILADTLDEVLTNGQSASGSTSAATQPGAVSALQNALSGSWVGTLEYRDYSEAATSLKRVKLPTWLRVEMAGVNLLFQYVYDDGPTKTVTEKSTVTIDASANRYVTVGEGNKTEEVSNVEGLGRLREGRGSLTLTGTGTENDAPVTVRTTMRIGRNILEIQRETAPAGQPFTFRHAYTFVRAATPTTTSR